MKKHNPEDFIGKKFGQYTIVEYVGLKNYHRMYKCICDCKNKTESIIDLSQLKSGYVYRCKHCRYNDLSIKQRKYNNYILTGQYGICIASNSNTEFLFDLEDYNKIKQYCWRENQHGYAITSLQKTKSNIFMHNIITGFFPGNCDHINRKRYDNRKENLRFADPSKNTMNQSVQYKSTSGIIGVVFNKKKNIWRSRIGINHESKHLGEHKEFNDAVKARLLAEKQYFGEFAPQRHLFKEYGIEEDE